MGVNPQENVGGGQIEGGPLELEPPLICSPSFPPIVVSILKSSYRSGSAASSRSGFCGTEWNRFSQCCMMPVLLIIINVNRCVWRHDTVKVKCLPQKVGGHNTGHPLHCEK